MKGICGRPSAEGPSGDVLSLLKRLPQWKNKGLQRVKYTNIKTNIAAPLQATPGIFATINVLSHFQATAKTAILFIQPQYNVTTLLSGTRRSFECKVGDPHNAPAGLSFSSVLRILPSRRCLFSDFHFSWRRSWAPVSHTSALQTFFCVRVQRRR